MRKLLSTEGLEIRIGRYLLAMLFFAGAVQKTVDPTAAQSLLSGVGLPETLVWPAMVFNFLAAFCLLINAFVRPVALALAFYCIATSFFHLVPADDWQMSILVKNWAIAGGLLVLAGVEAEPSGSQKPVRHS